MRENRPIPGWQANTNVLNVPFKERSTNTKSVSLKKQPGKLSLMDAASGEESLVLCCLRIILPKKNLLKYYIKTRPINTLHSPHRAQDEGAMGFQQEFFGGVVSLKKLLP